MQQSMKQLKYITQGKVECVEVPVPDYGDEGLLVKVAYAGICGSDIRAYTQGSLTGGIGENTKFGHEFAGTVVKVGSKVEGFEVGDRVWLNPDYANPEGQPTSCMAGGFSEYCGVLKVIPNVSVFKVPDNVPLRTAALIEPFGVAVRTKNRAGVKAGDKVLMWGAGPIGLMGWTAMKHQGVEDIVVAERMPERIEFARKMGAHVFDNSEDSASEYAEEVFGIAENTPDVGESADVDVYIDYVGNNALLEEYLDEGRMDSTFATLSLDMNEMELYPGMLMMREARIVGSRSYSPADIAEVIEVLRDTDIDISALITDEFSLEQGTEAFEAACDRNRGMKVVFKIGCEE